MSCGRIGILVLLAALAVTPAAGQEKAATPVKGPALAELVPEGTLAIFSIPDVAGSLARYRQTIPGKFMEYLTSRDYEKLLRHMRIPSYYSREFRDLFGDWKRTDDRFRERCGFSFEEAAALISGEIAVAVVDVVEKEEPGDRRRRRSDPSVDLIVKIGWNDAAKGEKFLRGLLKDLREMNEMEPAKGYRLFVPSGDSPDVPAFAVTPSGFFFATRQKRMKEVLATMTGGKGTKSLASSVGFAGVSRHLKTIAPDITIWLNWERIHKVGVVQEVFDELAPDLLDDLGLEHLKSAAYLMKIDGARIQDAVFLELPKGERRGFLKVLSTPETEVADGVMIKNLGDVGGLAVALTPVLEELPYLLRDVGEFMTPQIAKNEKSVIGSMKNLRDMSAVFRVEDSDRNTINDFWTADVSGLYRVLNAAGTEIRKIEVPLAMADAAPTPAIANYVGTALCVTPVPKAGYYFRAMTTDETGTTYLLNALTDASSTLACHTNKFAFCAYPAEYGKTGKYIFIISQETVIWKKDTGSAAPVLTWPATNPKSAGWTTVD